MKINSGGNKINIFFVFFSYFWLTFCFGAVFLGLRLIFLNFIFFVSFFNGWKFLLLIYLIIIFISLVALLLFSSLYFLIRFIQEKIIVHNLFSRIIMYIMGLVFSIFISREFFTNYQIENHLNNNQLAMSYILFFVYFLSLDYLYCNKSKFFKKRI